MEEDERTLWCGNLSDKVTEEILYELFLQGGPVQRVSIPKDREGKQRTYGFITYKYANSVPYALRLFDGTMLFNRRISMQRRNNTDSSEKPPENALNFEKLLQLGQQMLLANTAFRSALLPSDNLSDFSRYNKVDTKYQEDRSSRRMHPYQLPLSRPSDNDPYKDTWAKMGRERNRHYTDNYSRRNYKSSRHGYR